MPHDVIKEIADKVAISLRSTHDFRASFHEVMKEYPHLEYKSTQSQVASNLGSRKKGRKQKTKHTPRQAELPLGITRTQALRDAKAHEAELTRGLPEHDL